MANASTTSLVDALRQYRLLESVQLEEVKALQARFPEPKALAGDLIRRGWLTPYQANQLLLGRGQELLLGSYVLLEKLGEGGMGTVFKARSWKLGRLVALKLICKERLDNPDAIRRFEREVRSAAALSHPNIVHAQDADQIGGTPILVMEYVEGIDLSKWVKKKGPLSVPQACEYIRQAALGLQHAFERGVVHRDIKPANLLLTANGSTVKVLDMGLARLDQSAADDDRSTTMTQEGMVMGTPDYIAPEQALASHTVDIRADLYSLGCTFYYLLTGQVPFPGGTLTQKLLNHQLHTPKPVEQLRPDLSPEVAVLVRKMMAKKPEDRYQTPAEVAGALASLLGTGHGAPLAANGNDRTAADGAQGVAAPSGDSLSSALDYMAQGGHTEAGDSPHRLAQKAAQRRRRLSLLMGGLLVLAGLAVVLFVAFEDPGRKKQPVNEQGSPAVVNTPARARVDQQWLEQVAALPAEKQGEAVSRKLQELNPGFDGKVTDRIEDGVVTELNFITDRVTDISPVRALAGIRTLTCNGSWGSRGRLADLSSLKGMKLTTFKCSFTQVSDLSPLRGMPLTTLYCGESKVSDLSPLRDMKLTELWCFGTPVSDLSPLKDMKLMVLLCHDSKVSDLSPLKGMPLKELLCDFKPERDTDLLRSITTLEKINEKPSREFWQDMDARQAAFASWCKQVAALPAERQVEAVSRKLQELNPGFDGKVTHNKEGDVVTELEFLTDQVTDISPVKALSGLRTLNCGGSNWGKGQLSDLRPLRGMKLDTLTCGHTKVADLSPLKDMKLTRLYCYVTPVSDLSPLRDMKLTVLNCGNTKVPHLLPLKNMLLTALICDHTSVSDLSPLKGMPLKELHCDYNPERDTAILRSLKTLETINDKPAKEFWKEVNDSKR